MTLDPHGHAPADTLQAFHEETLSPADEARVRAHLEGCPRCRAEAAGWERLFAELGSLPRVAPPEDFAERVMAGVGRRRSAPARLLERLKGLLPGTGRSARPAPASAAPGAHPGPDRIQDLLDGALPAAARARVEVHLSDCPTCAREAEAWRGLLGAFSRLPELAPSAGFAERVMGGFDPARTRAAAPAAHGRSLAGLAARLAAALGGLVPSTRRGWAVVTGVAFTPTVALVTIAWAVAAHPLVTLDAVRTFVSWKVADLGAGTWAGVRETAVGNPLLFRGWELLSEATSTPAAALGGGALLAALMLASLWTLYRNLIGSPEPDVTNARASS